MAIVPDRPAKRMKFLVEADETRALLAKLFTELAATGAGGGGVGNDLILRKSSKYRFDNASTRYPIHFNV